MAKTFRHSCKVHIEVAPNGNTDIMLDCSLCGPTLLTIPSAHVAPLAVVLTAICRQEHIHLDKVAETLQLLSGFTG